MNRLPDNVKQMISNRQVQSLTSDFEKKASVTTPQAPNPKEVIIQEKPKHSVLKEYFESLIAELEEED